MKYKIGNEITLENGKEYTVLDIIDYNNKKYFLVLYDDNKMTFLKYSCENENDYFENIPSDEEYKCVLEQYYKSVPEKIKRIEE